MTWRIVMWYRTRRWLRWSIDVVTVALLTLAVAVAHTLVFNDWSLTNAYRLMELVNSVQGHH